MENVASKHPDIMKLHVTYTKHYCHIRHDLITWCQESKIYKSQKSKSVYKA